MIFTSLGLLVVSACFFIAGIIKSSVALLVVSLVCTGAAVIVLLATADLARRKAWAETAGGVAAPGVAGPPAATPMVVYLPADQLPHMVAAGNGRNGSATEPIVGYDDMTTTQINRLVTRGALTDEQLEALRAYESAHAARKTVLDRVDRALAKR